MVKCKNIIDAYCLGSEIVISGEDARVAYDLLKRIYERTKVCDAGTLIYLKEGTRIFKDEFAVLEKLFQ